jgi:hypothetical protein
VQAKFLVTGAFALATLAMPAASSAAIVQCGDVLTASTRVDNDLVGCATPNALEVDGTGITINLNGHELIGTGSGTGILVRPTASGVTVANGEVDHFATGVDTQGPDTTLTALGLEDNGTGARLFADRVSALSNYVNHNDTGLQISEFRTPHQPAFAGVVVRDNTVMRNTRQGIVVWYTTGAQIVKNTIGLNGIGIRGDNAYNAVVDRNYVSDNDGHGITGVLWDGTKFTANKTLRNTGSGFSLEDSYVDVIGNTSSNNGGSGFAYGENGGTPQATRFGDNKANDNAAWGFALTIGATDLGGNVAHRNGAGDFGYFHP